MHYTKHAQIRLAQRGISKSMISAVMDYGSRDHERKRWTLGRKQAVETDSNILTAWCN